MAYILTIVQAFRALLDHPPDIVLHRPPPYGVPFPPSSLPGLASRSPSCPPYLPSLCSVMPANLYPLRSMPLTRPSTKNAVLHPHAPACVNPGAYRNFHLLVPGAWPSMRTDSATRVSDFWNRSPRVECRRRAHVASQQNRPLPGLAPQLRQRFVRFPLLCFGKIFEATCRLPGLPSASPHPSIFFPT